MADHAFPGKLEEYLKYKYSKDENLFLDKVIKDISSDDQNKQLEGTAQIRKMIEHGPDPPFMRIIQSGVVSHLIKFLGRDEFSALQMEAIYILGLLVRKAEYVNELVDIRAKLTELISSPDGLISIMAIDSLVHMNIVETSLPTLELRKLVWKKMLEHLRNENNPPSMHVIAAKALHSILLFRPSVKMEESDGVRSIFHELLQSSSETAIAVACQTLLQLSLGEFDMAEFSIMFSGTPRLIERLVELLKHNSESIIQPALLTLGNVATVEENVMEDDGPHLGAILRDALILKLVKPETLNRFGELLAGNFNNFIKGILCAILQVIATENWDFVESIINHEIIDKLTRLYKSCDDESVRREVAKVIANVANQASNYELSLPTKPIPNATPTDNVELMSVGQACIEPLCGLLDYTDDKQLVLDSLNGLRKILVWGRAEEDYFFDVVKEMIEKSKGLMKIQVLQEKGEASFKDALQMLLSYWPHLSSPKA